MKEMVEFRVVEKYVSLLFDENEGQRLGYGVRKIIMDATDPRFATVGCLQHELNGKYNESFFHGWNIKRIPSPEEVQQARLFQLIVSAYFEPAGEECGTEHDEASSCPVCRAGARQIGPLAIRVGRIPKRKEIATTIAEEIVVSRRVAGLFEKHQITGVELGPVRMGKPSGMTSPDWFQLTVPKAEAEIIAPTCVGIEPFDDDPEGECRCPRGDLIGLNLLSAVSILDSTRGEADFVASRQYVGVQRGLLRPRRLIFVSPRVRELFVSEKIKGCEFEIATLASEPGARQSWNV